MKRLQLAIIALLCVPLLGIQGGRSTRGAAPGPVGPCNVADDFEEDTMGTDWIEYGPQAPDAFGISGGTMNVTTPVTGNDIREWVFYQAPSGVASPYQWCSFTYAGTTGNEDEQGCAFRVPTAKSWEAGDQFYYVVWNRYGRVRWATITHPDVYEQQTTGTGGPFAVAGWRVGFILDLDGTDRVRAYASSDPAAYQTCDNSPDCGWGPATITLTDFGFPTPVPPIATHVGLVVRSTSGWNPTKWDDWEAGPVGGEECP